MMRIEGLLLVAFIVLKLTAVIDWSWWWVLSPAWLPLAVIGVICGAGMICGTLSGLWERYVGR